MKTERYEEVLVDILRYMDGKRILTQGDVAAYTGKSTRTIRRWGIGRAGIHASDLARFLISEV